MFTGVSTRWAGTHWAVGDRSDTSRAAQDGVTRAVAGRAVAGRAVGDRRHIWLPVGERSRVDWAANWTVGNRSRARPFAGAGYVEGPRASWPADGRCRRPWAAADRLAGGRWASNRLTANGLTALDYVAGGLTWTRHTDPL